MEEAAMVCFEERSHPIESEMTVSGCFVEQFIVRRNQATEQMRRTWADDEVATEHGAYGIAALLIRELTPFTVVERSRKGTGFDYWLGMQKDEGDSQYLFQKKARLEVSGIREGTAAEIKTRSNKKLIQIRKSSNHLVGYVVIVEFGTPMSNVEKP